MLLEPLLPEPLVPVSDGELVEPVLGLLVEPELPVEEPLDPVSDGELVEPPIEPEDPELPDEEPPSEPLEPVSDEPELPECFEELPEEPFGMTSMFVTSEPEKLART